MIVLNKSNSFDAWDEVSKEALLKELCKKQERNSTKILVTCLAVGVITTISIFALGIFGALKIMKPHYVPRPGVTPMKIRLITRALGALTGMVGMTGGLVATLGTGFILGRFFKCDPLEQVIWDIESGGSKVSKEHLNAVNQLVDKRFWKTIKPR